MKTLPEAIATIEGFYASGMNPNRSQRNNNPGNLNLADWLKAPPYNAIVEKTQPGVQARFARFPTSAQGWQALNALLLGAKYRSLTIEQAINRYAPPVENDTHNYVTQVCKWVGCKPTDTVEQVMTGTA